MATTYEEVFSRFRKKISAPELLDFDDDEIEEMMIEWLDSAIAFIEADQLSITNDLSERDNEDQEFGAELSNLEKELVAMYMVVAWYEDKINSAESTYLMVYTKDERSTPQEKRLDALIRAQESKRLEARKYFRNYGFARNEYLDNI